MPHTEHESAALYWEVTDLTPPWEADPPVVLFCHGVATNADVWAGWLPVLADRYRMVRFDLRGFGRSRVSPGPHGWSLDVLGADVLAVADAAGADRFHLVGESTGGTVALHLAARREARLRSITVSNASHRGTSIARVGAWRDFIDSKGMTAWSEEMMTSRFAPGELSGPMYAWYHQVQAATDPEALLGVADMLIKADLTADLPRIDVPTLVLAPGSSPFVSADVLREIADAVPGAELHPFPGARHGLPYSRGAACAGVLRRFLGDRRLD